MSLERKVLSLLTIHESWERYKKTVPEGFFHGELKTLYSQIKRYWEVSGETSDHISRGAMIHMVESLDLPPTETANLVVMFQECLDLVVSAEEEEPAIREAVFKWTSRQILQSAVVDLENHTLNPGNLAKRFADLQALVESQKQPEISPLDVAAVLETEQNKHIYPTGILELDSVLGGGLWQPELGLILAPTFVGKTSALVSFGAQALLRGESVYMATGEVARNRLIIRFYQSLLNLTRDEVLFNPELVQTKLSELNLPEWQIDDFSGSGASTTTIGSRVREFFGGDPKGGLILVDHLELGVIRPSTNSEGRFALGDAAEELRQIAVQNHCGLWTAQQSDRQSLGGSRVTMSNAAESLHPVRKSDVVISLSQDLEERREGIMRAGIEKGRERTITQSLVMVKANLPTQRLEGAELCV